MMRETPSSALVTLRDVVLARHGRQDIGPLTWELNAGEHWAIIGPVGSGKDLLAEALAGHVQPAWGQVAYRLPDRSGNLMTDAQTARRLIAHLTFGGRPNGAATFHQARWHANLATASPEVASVLSVEGIWQRNPFEVREDDRGVTEAARGTFGERRERILNRLKIAPLLLRRLHQLSDGEWRRVQLARALLRAPRLLILDDPLTGQDWAFQREIGPALLEAASREGIGLVLLIAAPSAALDVCTHALVLDEGRAVAQGPRDEVLAQTGLKVPAEEAITSGDAESASGAAPVISLRDVNVVHGGVRVLAGVSWTVNQGEKWALVGPNGAGKSTLLSLILGDHPQAYANDIALFGRPRGSGESIWEIKRRIGWVSPELHRYHPPLVPAFDAVCSGFFDTLGLHRACSDVQQAEARTWMARLGIAGAAATPFRGLTRGQQRLVLIARALVKDPELLILDEPCQGLDAAHIGEVLEALAEVTRAPGRTMVYVTHRPSEFPRGLTHVLGLAAGRVVQSGRM